MCLYQTPATGFAHQTAGMGNSPQTMKYNNKKIHTIRILFHDNTIIHLAVRKKARELSFEK